MLFDPLFLFLALIFIVFTICAIKISFFPAASNPNEKKENSSSEVRQPRRKLGVVILPYVKAGVYFALVCLVGWFFCWSFVYDTIVWRKDLYQIIESQQVNVFFLFLSTLALLVAREVLTRIGRVVVSIGVSPSQMESSNSKIEEPPRIKTVRRKEKVDEEKKELPPMVRIGERLVDGKMEEGSKEK